MYVPKDLRIASWLTEAMGAAGAAALIDMYGGEAIELPLDPFNENSPRARARRIAEAIDAGLANQIARAEGVTRRAVLGTLRSVGRHSGTRQRSRFRRLKSATTLKSIRSPAGGLGASGRSFPREKI